MTVAFVTLNDLRICDKTLLDLGLTLPGLTERGEVLARLPSLSMLTLAALTPEDWQVRYIEAGNAAADMQLPDADLVAITAFTASIDDAYRLADACRAHGSIVVLGGLHVTSCPEEAAAHADAIVVGEAEPVWRQLLEDFKSKQLCRIYSDPSPGRFDLSQAPVPRFDLLTPDRYPRVTLQTQRGCPLDCEFCASSKLFGAGYRQKPMTRVRTELDAISARWPRPYIELADDNTFCNRAYARDLCRLLAEYDVRWFTETDVAVADDPELLDLMYESGCREVLVGFESIFASSLDGLDATNWKQKRLRCYRETIDRIQSHGVAVNGCFILGLDGDDASVFGQLVQFVDESGMADAQVTVLTPFPNTRLYDRLRREGRLLRERFWQQCTLLDVVFRPKQMSVEQLEERFRWTIRELFNRSSYRARRRRFVEQTRILAAGANRAF